MSPTETVGDKHSLTFIGCHVKFSQCVWPFNINIKHANHWRNTNITITPLTHRGVSTHTFGFCRCSASSSCDLEFCANKYKSAENTNKDIYTSYLALLDMLAINWSSTMYIRACCTQSTATLRRAFFLQEKQKKKTNIIHWETVHATGTMTTALFFFHNTRNGMAGCAASLRKSSAPSFVKQEVETRAAHWQRVDNTQRCVDTQRTCRDSWCRWRRLWRGGWWCWCCCSGRACCWRAWNLGRHVFECWWRILYNWTC